MSRFKGQLIEEYACDYLQKQGLILQARNYRCKCGEIDLIMQEDGCCVFVEVRYREVPEFGSGLESITRSKQTKIIRTAHYYLQENQLVDKQPCRFDVVGVGGNGNESLIVDWIQNAFQVKW